jgi:DNA-binding transcriptional MerR regulator
MQPMLTFEMGEVAEIIGLAEPTIKFWTIGRPLTIKPSVHAAGGKGSRNLYNRDDLVLFALAKQMRDDGLPGEAVQKAIDVVKADLMTAKFIALARVGKKHEWAAVAIVSVRDCFAPTLNIPFFGSNPVMSLYVVDVKQVVTNLDEAISTHRRKRR